MSASGNPDIMEPFHAIPNDLLSGPLSEGPSDSLLRPESEPSVVNDTLGGLFGGGTDARFPFTSGLGVTADPLAGSSARYEPAFAAPPTSAAAAHVFDAPGPLLSSLHTPSASGSGSFALTLAPGSPLSPNLLPTPHTDSPQMVPDAQASRHFLPLGSASYGPSTTAGGSATDTAAQRGSSLGGPGQSLADDLWPRRQPGTVEPSGLAAGLDWGTSLPGVSTRRTSRLGPAVLQEAFPRAGSASSPRSQATYAGADEGMYTGDRGVGLLPGDAAAVWGRPEEKLVADSGRVLQGADLAGRWPDDLRSTIGADPGGLWVFAPPGSAAVDHPDHERGGGLGGAASRMHTAAAPAPSAGLAGMDRTAGQGLFAFGAPGASVFGTGGSSWSALPEPPTLAERQGDDAPRLGMRDMPSFLHRDLPYGGLAVGGGMEPGGGGISGGGVVPGLTGVSGAVDMVMQDSVQSAGGSQWSESSQSQRKMSEFNVHAAEFQVRRPRMSSKELCLPHDLIE